MKDHVKILLVGDEGVGKSSLISAYISQHFPQEVPPVMTDAIIPPETTANDVCVTIMDSSSNPGDREVLRQKIIAADSVIALYDVTRPETFESLGNFWLPLIKDLSAEQYKPVILVGTKTDLLIEEQDTQQLNSLLLAFPFVMNCWNCSAVNIQNLDTVFFLAELFVNFPLSFILDVTEEEFTPAARRAFLRIFRIFDIDGDNLLCDAELSDTQLRCFDDLINTDELMALKRQISMEVPGGVLNNCVTFEGFVGLIKMNLIAHQYQIPWLILRSFNYDDNLNIVIPEEITKVPELAANQVTELSASARSFLLHLAQIAYNETQPPIAPDSDSASEVEDSLTWDALKIVLSVLSNDTLDPWSDPPSFKTAWRHDESVEQRILLRGLSHVGATLTFEDWLTHWSLLALNEPAVTQMLLFKLGYVERPDLGVVPSSGPLESVQKQALLAGAKHSYFRALFGPARVEAPLPRSTLQVCVLGDNGVGKSSFVWYMTGLRAPGLSGDVEMGVEFSKYSDSIVVGGCSLHREELIARRALEPRASAVQRELLQSTLTTSYQLSVAAVPLEQVEKWLEHSAGSCDLVVLMFQCGKETSLKTAIALESRLPDSVPRLYLASKTDTIVSAHTLNISASTSSLRSDRSDRGDRNSQEYGNETKATREALKAAHEKVLQIATLHIKDRNLPPLALLSTLSGEGISEACSLIVDVTTDPTRGIPRKNAKISSSFVTSRPFVAGVTVVLGIVSITFIVKYKQEVKDWFSQVFSSTREFFTSRAITN